MCALRQKFNVIDRRIYSMDRALVVMDPGEGSKELLAEAGDFVQGIDADVILLVLMTEESYEREVDVLNQIGEVEDSSYRHDAPLKGAERFTEEVARAILDDDVEYTSVSRLIDEDEEAETIIEIADEYECDHIFLSGRKRSPTGKALFGDRTQAVLLNADSYVTVAMKS